MERLDLDVRAMQSVVGGGAWAGMPSSGSGVHEPTYARGSERRCSMPARAAARAHRNGRGGVDAAAAQPGRGGAGGPRLPLPTHAVVAVVRGVAWEGVSLVSAWVTGPNHDDFDWEALEIDTDIEPAEAEAPWGYAEQIRVRGDQETS